MDKMPQKENSQQLEIFSLEHTGSRPIKKQTSFLSFVWGHEKIILMIIALLAGCVISFSLGVERGKKSVLKKEPISNIASQNLNLQQNLKQLPVKEAVIQNKPLNQPATVVTTAKSAATAKGFQNYTIQVATYKSKNSAQKEVRDLKNKGFKPMVFSKDDRIQLCVGQFFTKDEAQSYLKELKKRYQDCFIRRL